MTTSNNSEVTCQEERAFPNTPPGYASARTPLWMVVWDKNGTNTKAFAPYYIHLNIFKVITAAYMMNNKNIIT